MSTFWPAGPLLVVLFAIMPTGAAAALPQENASASAENAGTATRSWEIGGAIGVALADGEGVTKGPLFAASVGKELNENWVLQGQFRAWIGRPVERPGRDDNKNKQWMTTFRALYVYELGRARPLIGIGGGWDRISMTSGNRETSHQDALFTLVSFGIEASVGGFAVRPVFELQIIPLFAPQVTTEVVYKLGG